MSTVKALALKKGSALAVFNEYNFYQIIKEIEKMEQRNENIWVPIGILERMYDDDIGYIDKYFHNHWENRDIEDLLEKLNKNFDK